MSKTWKRILGVGSVVALGLFVSQLGNLPYSVNSNSNNTGPNTVKADTLATSTNQSSASTVGQSTSTNMSNAAAENTGSSTSPSLTSTSTPSNSSTSTSSTVGNSSTTPGTTGGNTNLTSAITSQATSTASSAIPTGLSASLVTSTAALLSWNAPASSGSTSPSFSYALYRNGNQIATTTATSFSDSGLSPNTSYSYTVASIDNSGNSSGQSAPLSVLTMLPESSGGGTNSTTTSTSPISPTFASTSTSTSSTTATLTAPTNLMASSTASSIMLSWSPSTASSTGSSTVSGYNIIRNGQTTASTTATSFTDTGLSANTTYAYNVSAFDSSGNSSPWSATVFATTGQGGNNSTTATTTLTNLGKFGWAVISASLYNQIFGTASSTTTTSTPQSPFTFINGYPTLNGNYLDCNGNIDNDMAHHTTDVSDTDPAHHLGQNCPGSMPILPSNMNVNNMMPGSNAQSWMFNLGSSNGQISQWVVVPLDGTVLQKLYQAALNGQINSMNVMSMMGM